MYAIWKCQDCRNLFLRQSVGLYSCKKKIFTDAKKKDAECIVACGSYKEVPQKG